MLEFTRVREVDLELLRLWRMQPEVTHFMYSDPVISKEEQKEWFEKIKLQSEASYWIIRYDNKPIGHLNIKVDIKNKIAVWGIYIGESEFRGKGLFKSINYNMQDYIFYVIGANKSCSQAVGYNTLAIEKYQKCGLKIEGILRQSLYKYGRFHDIVTFGLLKSEWDVFKETQEYEKANWDCAWKPLLYD